jgi:hypothetical protein
MANWNQVKFHYEVLGEPVEVLARQFGLSPLLLENTIQQEEWTRKPVATKVAEWTNAEQTSDLMVEVADKAKLLNTLRATNLGPEYYKVEAAFIEKLLEVVANVDAQEPDAAKHMAKIADCLTVMRPVDTSAAGGDKDKGGFTVIIGGGFGQTKAMPEVVCDITPLKQLEN